MGGVWEYRGLWSPKLGRGSGVGRPKQALHNRWAENRTYKDQVG